MCMFTADQVTVTVHVGDEWVNSYDLPITLVSSMAVDGEFKYAQYGGDTAQNPARSHVTIYESEWEYGYQDYTAGTFHEFDYFDESNSWYYATGDTLWGDASGTFHGAYNASQGLAMANVADSSIGIAYQVKTAAAQPNANDMDFAILNKVLADVTFEVATGDTVVFVFEYVDGRAKANIAPGIRFVDIKS